MDSQPSPAQIAIMILASPAWVRLGIAVRDPRLRERAADVLAARIVEGLGDRAEPDPRQMSLPSIT